MTSFRTFYRYLFADPIRRLRLRILRRRALKLKLRRFRLRGYFKYKKHKYRRNFRGLRSKSFNYKRFRSSFSSNRRFAVKPFNRFKQQQSKSNIYLTLKRAKKRAELRKRQKRLQRLRLRQQKK